MMLPGMVLLGSPKEQRWNVLRKGYGSIIHTTMLDGMLKGGQIDVIDVMLQGVPIGRLRRPKEIANAVLWLCSDAANFVIGHTQVVDGGYNIQ